MHVEVEEVVRAERTSDYTTNEDVRANDSVI